MQIWFCHLTSIVCELRQRHGRTLELKSPFYSFDIQTITETYRICMHIKRSALKRIAINGDMCRGWRLASHICLYQIYLLLVLQNASFFWCGFLQAPNRAAGTVLWWSPSVKFQWKCGANSRTLFGTKVPNTEISHQHPPYGLCLCFTHMNSTAAIYSAHSICN